MEVEVLRCEERLRIMQEFLKKSEEGKKMSLPENFISEPHLS